ncbi:MAG TPA: type II toxin-antitoxin system Phd/YefM family antitoxin [Fimbriimonadaceae bacterium]|jgi:PHD/YefM family antitoxin component YafN of YafNO toxin-antitoxin module
MIRPTNIHSVTDFTRNAKTYIDQVKESKEPIALTVNGNAEVILQDANSYQQLMDEVERSRFIAAIREGEKAVREGRVYSSEEVFADLKTKLGL